MKRIIFLFLLFISSTGFAQELSGRVVDEAGEPLVGATILWEGTTIGTMTNLEGEYRLHRVKGHNKLQASFVGYTTEFREVVSGEKSINFTLKEEGIGIESVVVESTLSGNFVKQDGLLKGEMISFAGLCKMACCNLAESFENSASVTVGYSDAISGARQIKMLGLAGTYTQILDENRPIMRGLSAPYGLSYTPGMWLNSIQVSKGVASVTAGHEAITGQINLEHRKPTDSERLFINAYLDDELRPELNISSALPVTKDNKLTTIILAHGSLDTDENGMDHNHDTFRDMPRTRQINVANRWLYQANSGLQLRWGAKYVEESRLGGMTSYTQSMHEDREELSKEYGYLPFDRSLGVVEDGIYGSHIHNRNANAYVKLGTPLGASVYDEENQEELRSNIATIIDYDFFSEDAYFGLNDYRGEENTVTMNLMYNHYFTPRSTLIVGLSSQLHFYEEQLHNIYMVGSDTQVFNEKLYNFNRNEHEVGLYAEYTYSIKDKFSLVIGARGDYNTYYDKFYFTPRGHIKWNITPTTVLRASAGMGYRSTNLITDNIGVVATGRAILVEEFDNMNRMEEALTFGGSLTQTFTLVQERDATISFDYFRSQFYNQVVADQEFMPGMVYFYNSDNRSYTDSYQVDFTWTPVERFDIFATFRYTDSAITLNRRNGEVRTVERPLISEYKTLLNLQYATKFRRWTFDATLQYNGRSRLPSLDGDIDNLRYSPAYPMLFAQVTHKVGKFDIYLGCENILDYTQDDAIQVGGEKFESGMNPFDSTFNSSAVWGPLMGRKIYIGLRFNLY